MSATEKFESLLRQILQPEVSDHVMEGLLVDLGFEGSDMMCMGDCHSPDIAEAIRRVVNEVSGQPATLDAVTAGASGLAILPSSEGGDG